MLRLVRTKMVAIPVNVQTDSLSLTEHSVIIQVDANFPINFRVLTNLLTNREIFLKTPSSPRETVCDAD